MDSGSRWIFDGRNILEHQALMKMGFQVHCVGKALHLDGRQDGRRTSVWTNGQHRPYQNGGGH